MNEIVPSGGGGQSATLLIDLIEQVAMLQAQMRIADQQRILLMSQIEEVRKEARNFHAASDAVRRLEPIIIEGEKFRLKVEGGALVMKGVWMLAGAVLLAFVQWGISHLPKAQ